MVNSVVMIVPVQYRDTLNALAPALNPDYGPDTWSIPLSASGSQPATHYGTHLWEQPGGVFHQMRIAVQAGVTPPGLEAYAVPLASIQVKAVENSLDGYTNWQTVLSELGLQAIEEVG